MKGDISADFHAPAKRYSGVRAQQGRVLTDADFNAAMDVVDDAMETLVRTLLCAAGTPDTGFSISAAIPATLPLPDGSTAQTLDFEIAPGAFVLGGRALMMRPGQRFLDQTDWLSMVLDPGDLPPAPVDGRFDLAYLEMIVQPVRAVEDREIQERALGQADTTTRLRPQVRVRVHDDTARECVVAAAGLRAELAGAGGSFSDDRTELLSNARLRMGFAGDGPVTDPCAPRTLAGYLGAENQTLKIMLTEGGGFVWNHDHGEPLYRVQLDGDEVVFLTRPRDPVLYPVPDQVIEILPWDVFLPNAEKAAAPLGHRAVLTGHYDPARGVITYDGSLPADWNLWLSGLDPALDGQDEPQPRFFYARIWRAPEGGGTSQSTNANAMPPQPVDLPGTGVALTFTGTGFPGDYWTAALRPDAPEVIQPWQLERDGGAAPVGPRRFYAPLALLAWTAPAGAAATPEIDDCRNRFRRLCQIKGCCTYHVGDGRTTFGEFNTIQAAVDALPADGGEICLLPGRHDGVVDLSGLRRIVIHGCGPRTVVAAPEGEARPVFDITSAQDITLRDFRISHDGGFAVAGETDALRITLARLGIEVTGGAVALNACDTVTIEDCDISSRVLPAALTADDIPLMAPLIFLRGETLRLERSRLLVDRARNRNRVALGGLVIGGGSSGVVVRDCRIAGGNGNGITLGTAMQRGAQGPVFLVLALIANWLTLDDDGCIKIDPGGTTPPARDPDGTPPPVFESQGPVTRVLIRDNHIRDHGGSGITVGHWFLPPQTDDADFGDILTGDPDALDLVDDIEIEEILIAGNVIEGCMRLDLTSGLPVEAAFNSGFGGIALSTVIDIQIDDNEIRGCGGAGRSSICGIYLRHAERLSITANRIFDNGRPAGPESPLLVGNIGGIVIGHVEGREDGMGQELRQTPAAFIKDNMVVSPEGRALEMIGSGQMMVEGNSFTAHGNNSLGVLLQAYFALARNPTGLAPGTSLTGAGVEGQLRAFIEQLLGATVGILNTGMNPNVVSLLGSFGQINGKGAVDTANAATGRHDMFRLRDDVGRPPPPPPGPVLFNDNQVTFDAVSGASTLALSSISIISYDDVGMQDNHCAVDTVTDFVLVDALVLGLVSVRVQGNRFRETFRIRDGSGGFPISSLLSAASFGFLNATEMNQGTFCFLHFGLKKPRLIDDPQDDTDIPRQILDTNRHIAPDSACAAFRLVSSVVGVD
jgi:hypothetical protein